jgi:acyl-CoA thioesterase I
MPLHAAREARVTRPRRRSLLRAASAVLLLAGVVRLAAADAAPGQRTLVFFGDSLTAGYGLADPDTQSFPALIQGRIDAGHLPWKVVNAGLSGETSAGGLRRIDWIMRQQVDLLVLELGANDGLRGTAPAVTQANLQAIIDRVRLKYPATPIVLAGMRMPPSMGQDYVDAYDGIFPALALKNHLTLIPFLLEGVAARPELNQGDSIHPTAEGDRIVAEGVWKVIAPLLNIGS